MAAAAVFASNFVLWQDAGYFTENAALRPLTHLWSLAVEEQFYLVFPLILLATRRSWRLTGGVLALLAAASFAWNATPLDRPCGRLLPPAVALLGARARRAAGLRPAEPARPRAGSAALPERGRGARAARARMLRADRGEPLPGLVGAGADVRRRPPDRGGARGGAEPAAARDRALRPGREDQLPALPLALPAARAGAGAVGPRAHDRADARARRRQRRARLRDLPARRAPGSKACGPRPPAPACSWRRSRRRASRASPSCSAAGSPAESRSSSSS